MEKRIKMGNLEYVLSFTEDGAAYVRLEKADVHTADYRLLALMNEANDYFVFQETTEEEDHIRFDYAVEASDGFWDEASEMAYHEQLRLLLNVNRFAETLPGRLHVVLHPDNLVFDENLLPYCLYRGLDGVIAPKSLDEAEYLKQYQCLVVATLSNRYSFEELYEGCLPLAKDSNFIRSVAAAASLDELMELLEDEYAEEKAHVDKTMKLVPKKRHSMFVRLSVLLVALLVVLAVPLTYFALLVVPYQSNLLAANEAFLANDYELVISKLSGQDAAALPQASKYELAYSYIQGEPLSSEQLQNIMATTSLKSDERYLLFWIYTGQGNYEQAVDTALALGDNELVIYGVYKNIEDVTNDKTMGGTEKSEKLKELNATLEEAKKNFLGDGEGNNEAATPATDADSSTENAE